MANKDLTPQELIKRFADIQGISEEEATGLVGAETTEEILNKITEFTTKKIKANTVPLNRAQRRALAKKVGKKNRQDINTIADTAEKLNYIDLIQKLRKLNEKREREENGETTTENN